MVTLVDPLTAPELALMLADPGEIPATTPVLLTLAIVVSDVPQVAEAVIVFVVPSS